MQTVFNLLCPETFCATMIDESIQYTTEYVTSSLQSGVVLHTWRVKPLRAIIILQHGYGEHAERYIDGHCALIQQLGKHGLEVRAFDMWGHGRSPGVRGSVDVEKAIRDHLELRQEAKKENVPLFLLGHSLGAIVTTGSVIADPSLVDGVILTSPPFPGPVSTLVTLVLNAGAAIVPHWSLPMPRSPPSALSRCPELLQPAEADPLMVKRQIPFLLAASILRIAQAIDQGLKDWHVPTLVMHGAADKSADPQGSEHFVKGIGSKDKMLRLFESGLHELLNDSDREDSLQQILVWLDARID
ncbi:Alpha/Beta hydrolase protein [Trichoderma sp. SZMC 28014]